MKTPKTVVEGYYEIPYWGQMRFSVTVVDDELVFADGDKEYHHYFGFWASTYQFSDHPERHRLFDDIKNSIKEFFLSNQIQIDIPVHFKGEMLGMLWEKDGNCKLYRFYK